MKHKYLTCCITVGWLLLMTACGGSSDKDPVDPDDPDTPVIDFLDPSAIKVVMNSTKDASIIVLRTNLPWTAKSNADWLKLSATSGNKSTSIILGAAENSSFKRTASVTVRAGNFTKEIKVEQKPAPSIKFNIRGVPFTLLPVEADTSFYITGGAYYETRNVYLSSFYISETEITCEQWAAVTGVLSDYNYNSLPSHPVMENWNSINSTFIQQINRMAGFNFRLPTEVEWYVAASGGKKSNNTNYPGGIYINELAWHWGNSGGVLHAVAMKKSNELGLYDMAGNVSEWCYDWYQEWSESNLPPKEESNPMGPKNGTHKIVKGGDIWAGKLGEYDINGCEIYRRNYLLPNATIPDEFLPGTFQNAVGFRLVLSSTE